MDQHKYRYILEETMLPAAETLFANRPWIFNMTMILSIRIARSVKQWIDSQDFQSLWWPAQLPDLNPVEHLWQEVNSSVKNSLTKKNSFK